jgi:hypothetical protein
MTAHGIGKDALDEFLPESVFTREIPRIGVGEFGDPIDRYVAPNEVELDPIEAIAPSRSAANAAPVQMWPMLAAALVAIGVSMIAMAAFARSGFFAL